LKTKRNLLDVRSLAYRAVNTFHRGYKNHSINDMKQKSLSVLRAVQNTQSKAK